MAGLIKRKSAMRKKIIEETVIFISVFKWFFTATCMGVIVGFSTFLFLEAIEWAQNLHGDFEYYYVALPLAFVFSALAIKHLAPAATGYGTEKVIEAVHKKWGKMNLKVIPVKFVTTIVTLAAGGSVGKVGPTAQIGAGLGSVIADIFSFNDTDRKKLVICGISAGFASVFGAPIAGAIFGIEVLFVGGMMYEVLLPSFVAGIVGFQVAGALGVTHIYHPIQFVPVFSETFFIEVALAGIFFGLCSFALIETMNWSRNIVDKTKLSTISRAVIGGFILVILVLVFSGDSFNLSDYLGLGEETVAGAFDGKDILFCAFALKIIFTAITFSSGGSGGIITPMFFIGATAGAFYAKMLGLDQASFAAIGLVALLAGAANTPITASIMAVELFGPKIAPYAAIACIISFLMTGYRSIFPSQVVAFKKSASLDVEMGKVIDEINPTFKKRSHTAMDLLIRITEALGKIFKY